MAVVHSDDKDLERLVDLHVYVVPGDVWVEHLRLVYNEAVKDTVSAGFVRVFPDVTIYNLREEIEEQLGYDVIPKEFIFLRGVGRALTQVKGRQEFQLKVKNFVPPLASSPEIYVIEGSLVHQSPRALPAIGHRYSEPGTSRSTASDNPLDRSQVFSDPPPGRSHSQRRKDFEPLRKSDEYDSQRTDHDRLGNHGRRRDDHREAFVTQADAAKLLSTNLDQTAFSPDNDDSGSSPQNLKDSGYNTTPRGSQEYDDKTPKRPSDGSPDGRSRVRSRTYPSPSPERTSYPQTRPQSRSTPLSATPPASPLTSNPSPGQKVHKLDRSRAGSRAATYTSQTNEDSGIADSTPPEDDSRTLDRRKREEERQRREAEERRREEEDRREEEERRRREEEERWRRQRVRDEDEPSETGDGRGQGYDDYDDDDQSDARSRSGRSNWEGGQGEDTFSFRWPEPPGGGKKVEENFIGDDLLASFAAARAEQKQLREEKEKELRSSQEEQTEGQAMPRVFGVPGKGEELRYQNKEYAWDNRTGGDQSSARESYGEGTTGSYSGDGDDYVGMRESGQKGTSESHYGDNHSYKGGGGGTSSYRGDDESYRGREEMSDSYHSNDSNKHDDDDDGWPGERDHEKHRNQSRWSSEGTSLREPTRNQSSSLADSLRESEEHQMASTDANSTSSRSPTKEKEAQSKKERSRSNSPEHQVARFPSPPPLELPSSRDGGKTRTSESPKKSTRSKRRSSGAGADREDLLEELERIREERKNAEKKREEMVKKAKQLQNKTQHRRNQARDIWKKRYFEEKKKTTPLEENCNRLRAELDMTHRKLMSKLEGDKDGKRRFNVNTDPPSSKNNQKVQLTRIQHELDDLKEKVENAKMKLTSEMKLRNQAETELRALRAELTQKKIHAALTRNQQSNIMHTMDKVQPGYMPAKVMPPT